MADSKTEKALDLDDRGVSKNNPAAPGWEPTTRFHPSELPSNPVARAAFPKDLISDEWTSSPMGDNHPELRQARAERSMQEEQDKLDRMQEQLDEVKAQADDVTSAGTSSKKSSSSSSSSSTGSTSTTS